ncbi:MAG: hypothetical protein A2Y65_01280 [Deltaproteobacteria bacterium RBG_13_52_11]|nr:MAG: hypothetical protein A2Y65_01280 [Deltaproteobacteria bacterium RBG_13_52_11]
MKGIIGKCHLLMPWPGIRDVAWLVAMPKAELANEMLIKEAKAPVAEALEASRDVRIGVAHKF